MMTKTHEGEKKVIFFDGDCALCSGVVRWCHRRDGAGMIWYAPLAGEFAARHRAELSLPEGTGDAQTFVFWDGPAGRVEDRSRAAGQLLIALGGVWSLLGKGLLLVPRVIADYGYQIIAKNRRKWFGTNEGCALPPGSLRGQVLE